MATIDRKIREFSDLDMLFSAHPFNRDVTRKFDIEAIKASVKNLILTKNYERPFHPEIGCQVHALLFENFSSVTKSVAEKTIVDVLTRFEPRIRLINVEVKESNDENEFVVDIVFTPANSDRPITVTTTLNRAR